MPSGYSRTPKLLKGALIQFAAPMLVPIPNMIVFQYNPETMTRQLTPWETPGGQGEQLGEAQQRALSQPFDPAETFTVDLELDAADALEHPAVHPVAVIAGVADRVSAMEMLCYPPGESALGGLLSVSVNVSVGGVGVGGNATAAAADVVPRREVPIVLFFWGPGRIVPVRLTSFSVEEQQYSPLLYPIRAKVTVGLKVLTDQQLVDAEGDPASGAVVEIAKACYKYTRAQKEALAMANLANSVESVMGMLPV